MARILVCGTLAFDIIGTFQGALATAKRNIKLDTLTQGFGGCAMNIAYNLRRLGHQPVPFVYVGDDFAPTYQAHVKRLEISPEAMVQIPGSSCARGIVLTDRQGDQFTAFFPGPTGLDRHAQDLRRLAGETWEAVIIAPDLPEKMRKCAEGFASPARQANGLHRAAVGRPLRVWCPGQYAEMLETDDLMPMLKSLDLLIVNRHEWTALCAHETAEKIARRVRSVVITDGANPVTLLHEKMQIAVPVAPAVDPTGCGDAFAAALVGAKLRGRPLTEAVAAGVQQASRCLRQPGSQSH